MAASQIAANGKGLASVWIFEKLQFSIYSVADKYTKVDVYFCCSSAFGKPELQMVRSQKGDAEFRLPLLHEAYISGCGFIISFVFVVIVFRHNKSYLTFRFEIFIFDIINEQSI